MIPLAILCAVLVAVIAWQRGTIRAARARGEAIAANAASEHVTARQRAETDARLLADAYALLHDERHKGKMGNQAAWQAARDEWDANVKGAKA